jgi:ArsR family transcriptional regulator
METSQAVLMLAALAQDTRLTVFRALAAAGEEINAGALAKQLGVPANTLSFHLKELLHAQLIVSRREGRAIRYALAERSVAGLMAFLLEDCCGGNPALCGLGPCRSGCNPKRPKGRTRTRP